MKRYKLTKKLIDGFEYEGGKDIRWDSEITGLGVRMYPNLNKKAFILSYRFHGRQRLYTIGAYGVWTLDQARTKARALLVDVDNGVDPLAERQKIAQAGTVKELREKYIDLYAKPVKKTWADDERRLEKYLPKEWDNLKAEAVTGGDVESLHKSIGETRPYLANRLIEILAVMFDKGKQWGFVTRADWENPARGITHYKEKSRDRWVRPDEMPSLAKAIDAEPNVYARYAIWLYLLTGLRKTELISAKWTAVRWEAKELRIEETKNDKSHNAILTDAAIALLREIPKLAENPHIFPGKKKGAHLVNISKPWGRVRKAAGIEDVRLHDLRRTVGSWLAQSGNTLHLIGRVLNHSSQKTTEVYARLGQDHIRDAMERNATQMINVAKGKKASVTPISGIRWKQNRQRSVGKA